MTARLSSSSGGLHMYNNKFFLKKSMEKLLDKLGLTFVTFWPFSLTLGPFAICCGGELRRGQSGEQNRARQTVPLGGRAG